MANWAAGRLRTGREKANDTSPSKQTTAQKSTPTPSSPSEAQATALHTSLYTSPPNELAPPAPKETLARTQIYLRYDQIEFLDRLARETGPGCTRSEWIRYAIDLLMKQHE